MAASAALGAVVDPLADADTVVRVDGVTGAVEAVTPVGRGPLLLAATAGRVWTVNVEDANLSLVDPGSNAETRVRLKEVVGLAVAGESVWVAYDGNRLARLDGRTGTVLTTLRIGAKRLFRKGDSGFIAAGGGSLWLTIPVLGQNNRQQTLARIDPASGAVLARAKIPADPATPLVAGEALWILGRVDNSVTRLNLRTLQSRTVTSGVLPLGAAAGAGSIWIAHDFERAVWRVDPSSLRVKARVRLGLRVRGVAYGLGRVWAATETGLVSIDPKTNRVVRRIVLSAPRHDDGPIGVAVLGRSVWVSVE